MNIIMITEVDPKEVIDILLGKLEKNSCGCCDEGCDCGDCEDCDKDCDCCDEGCDCGDCPKCTAGCDECDCEGCDCEGCNECEESESGICGCSCPACSGDDEDFGLTEGIGDDFVLAATLVNNASCHYQIACALIGGSRPGEAMYEVSRAVSNIGEMAVLMKDLQITEADVETFIEEWKQLALSFRDMAMAAAKEGYADILVDTLVAANYRRIVEDIGNDEELAEAIAEAEEVVSEEDKETLNEFIRL